MVFFVKLTLTGRAVCPTVPVMTAKLFLVALLVVSWPVFAEPLPTFDDFRRIDRMRRLTGQLQSSELLKVTHMEPALILGAIASQTNVTELALGAAELLGDWAQRRTLYETALRTSSNSLPVAVRFACAAAKQGETELALHWAKYCQEKDSDNTVPWLTELWVRLQRKQPRQFAQNPPNWVANYRDYTTEACRARIRVLELAGYSAYSARRLGFRADSDALVMARDLCQPPVDEINRRLLKDSGEALQRRRQFLLSELVGQTLERSATAYSGDAANSIEVQSRNDEMETRRDRLKQRLQEIERNIVDFATESQMVQYFDDALALTEEEAMRRLATAARPSSGKNATDNN